MPGIPRSLLFCPTILAFSFARSAAGIQNLLMNRASDLVHFIVRNKLRPDFEPW